jgi:hypothetical protein
MLAECPTPSTASNASPVDKGSVNHRQRRDARCRPAQLSKRKLQLTKRRLLIPAWMEVRVALIAGADELPT